MKLEHLLPNFIQDARTVIQAYGLDFPNADHGKSGLKVMHTIKDVISKNRAYDDTHPGFADGHWKRVLPFDGRDYCYFYADGANDTHVETLLRAAKKALLADTQTMNLNLYNVTTPDGAGFNVMLVTSEPGTVIREL